MDREDFFSSYLKYTSNNESPTFFHRWAAIVGIGALLGRNYSLRFGHQNLSPNVYSMLLGNPGTRKSTAIKIMKSLMIQVGYDTIAADKTTKEKFLLDLSGQEDKKDGKDILEQNLWGDDEEDLATAAPRELFIAADEFNDFFGNNGIEFVSLLGTLWDFEGVYKNRIKNGISVSIPNPTISILGGNTPTGFSLAFPPEILGQGFFSRILLIYGESSGKKIAFPIPPSDNDTKLILTQLANIRLNARGEVKYTPEAKKLLEKIYTTWKGIDDVRFESYSNRRFTHLLKLCIIHSASRQIYSTSESASNAKEITEQDVICANTVLTHTEHLMPRALGEFGKSRNSDVVHKVMQLLDSATKPMTVKEIHGQIVRDMNNIKDVTDMMNSLVFAERVQVVNGGYLPKKKIRVEENSDCIDYSYLTDEERRIGK